MRIHILRVLLCCSLLLTVGVPLAAEQLPIKIYTTTAGLAHDRVKRIIRDSHGFLWFCTTEGLSRFDGERFTTYGVEHGLPVQSINDVLESRQGVYWVATNGGGVCRLNPARVPAGVGEAAGARAGRFTVYPVGDGPGTQRVNVLYEDRAQQLWAGTDAGLFRLTGPKGMESFRPVALGLPKRPDPSIRVWTILEDSAGHLWMGTSWGLLRCLSDGRIMHYPLQPSQGSDQVRSLLIDRAGRLWVGHDIGLLVANPDPGPAPSAGQPVSWRVQKAPSPATAPAGRVPLPQASGEAFWYTTADGLPHSSVRALYQASDGRIWVGTSSGLSQFDGHGFRRYTKQHGLSDNMVIALAEDHESNLWIGADSGGVMILARHGFITYGEADGLGHTRIASIFEGSDGKLYVISADWFIQQFDGKRFTAIRPPLPYPLGYSSTRYPISFRDRAGEWWVPTSGGLIRFPAVNNFKQLAETRPRAVYTTRDGLPSQDVFRLYEDARGDIWISPIAPVRDTLFRWERATQTFHSYSAADGLPPFNEPFAFAEDRSGNLWIGFFDGGLARYRQGRFTSFGPSEGVPKGTIRELYSDRAGRLWIASSQDGVGRIDDPGADRPHSITYTTTQGLASNFARCITEDRWGRIYIGTARGIDRLDPLNGHIKHYTTADGLASNEAWVAFRDRQDTLWFGSPQGLSRFTPELDPPRAPTILIDRLLIAGHSHPLSELGETEIAGRVLKADENQIQVDFFGRGSRPGEALRYQYRLEGIDRDWSAPTDQRTARYMSLSPGAYRFMVRAVNADGIVSPKSATVEFTIRPPVWRRGWFLALATLLLGLAIYAFYRHRVARLLELERARTRERELQELAARSQLAALRAQIHPHFLFNALNSIAELTRVDPERAEKSIERLSELFRHSLNLANQPLATLADEIRWVASYLEIEKIRLGDRLRFDIQVDPPLLNLSFPSLILQPLVENAIKHGIATKAEGGHIAIVVKDDGPRAVISVADSGQGISEAMLKKILSNETGRVGLSNVKDRLSKIYGEAYAPQIESQEGVGTRITIKIPKSG